MDREAMPAANDLRTMMLAAEQAEARGDHAGAERLLRQALGLQESTLGPQHPEVANTLNNLAIVSEMNGKLVEAEACYRRAFAIATANFPPGDPFVTTSRDNLEQFCAARGIPLIQTPPPAASSPAPAASSAPLVPVASSAPPAQAASPAPPPRPASPPPTKTTAPTPKAGTPPPPRAAAPTSLDDFPLRSSPAAPSNPRVATAAVAAREPSRGPAIAAILAVLLVLVVGGWYLIESNPAPASKASTPAPSPAASPSPAPSSAPSPPAAEPVTETAPAATDTTPDTAPAAKAEPVEPSSAASPTPPAAAAPERPAATTPTSSPNVVSAELCRNLTTGSAWRCTPASGTLSPGTIYFYTRIASGRDTTIQHRWYRDDRLHQSVSLRIGANPSGYRTYSRTGITADRAGAWKVELRAEDGQLLDEKTFVVQP